MVGASRPGWGKENGGRQGDPTRSKHRPRNSSWGFLTSVRLEPTFLFLELKSSKGVFNVFFTLSLKGQTVYKYITCSKENTQFKKEWCLSLTSGDKDLLKIFFTVQTVGLIAFCFRECWINALIELFTKGNKAWFLTCKFTFIAMGYGHYNKKINRVPASVFLTK